MMTQANGRDLCTHLRPLNSVEGKRTTAARLTKMSSLSHLSQKCREGETSCVPFVVLSKYTEWHSQKDDSLTLSIISRGQSHTQQKTAVIKIGGGPPLSLSLLTFFDRFPREEFRKKTGSLSIVLSWKFMRKGLPWRWCVSEWERLSDSLWEERMINKAAVSELSLISSLEKRIAGSLFLPFYRLCEKRDEGEMSWWVDYLPYFNLGVVGGIAGEGLSL